MSVHLIMVWDPVNRTVPIPMAHSSAAVSRAITYLDTVSVVMAQK